MANVPSGIASLPPGIGNFSPGGHYIPKINVPPGGYNIVPPFLPYAAGAGSRPQSPQPGAHGGRPNVYGPFDVTDPILRTFGIGSAFNPMTVFDLMNLGVSPFAGSGLPGYPPTPGGAFPGPTVGGPGSAPLPRSGGKGVMR
jgi:hypothetical protein